MKTSERHLGARRSLRTLAVAAFLAGASLGGNLSYGQLAPKENTDSIRGTVVNSVTHEPIARALVYSPDNRFATMTDNEGRFEFTFSQTDAGQGDGSGANRPNILLARKAGYLSETNYAPQNLSLNTPPKELTIPLMPEALIVGRVSLPTSEAPDRIQLELYQRQVREGRAHWGLARSVASKSTGEFRFAELLPGTYKLLTRELLDRDPLIFDPRGQLYGYPPVYYSVATGFAAASEIRLSAGETVQANLSLVRQPYYNVKIPLTNAPPGLGFNVNVFLAGQRGPGYALGYNNRDQAIEGMLPNGTYAVEASSFGPNNIVMAGSVDVIIHGGPIAGPVMTLTPASSVRVTVKEEFTSESGESTGATGTGFSPGISVVRRSDPTGPRRYLNVMLEPADDFGQGRGGFLRAPTGPTDDSLVLEIVPQGRYWVRVTSSRGFAASIRSGTTDLQQTPLEVGAGGTASPIEITMRDDAGELGGTVEGITPPATTSLNASADTSAMVSGGIVAIPPAPAHVYCIPLPDSGGTFTEVWVSPDGSFQYQLPPGAYRVLAFDRRQPELEYRNPEAMRAYDSKGPVVRLLGGQKEHLRLQLISTE